MDYDKSIVKPIETVLQREFITPFVDSLLESPNESLSLSNAFVLMRLSEKMIVELDRLYADLDMDIEAIQQKTLFLGYLGKIFQSALLLIGATDYIGAMVLLRCVFELLVGISTDTTGGMSERLSSIEYLDEDERKRLKKLWRSLSAWAHPYQKWEKHLCPKHYGCGRNFNPSLFKQCLSLSDQVLDLILVATIEQFGLLPGSYQHAYEDINSTVALVDISALGMFEKRLRENP